MPSFDLLLTASLEGVNCITLSKDNIWLLDVECTKCHQLTQRPIGLNPLEKTTMPGGRDEANIVAQCWNCSNSFSIDIVEDSISSFRCEEDESNEYQRIATFECRGCEPKTFHVNTGWTVSSAAGTEWHDVDLGSDEWADYDEASELPTTVSNISAQFSRSSGKSGKGKRRK